MTYREKERKREREKERKRERKKPKLSVLVNADDNNKRAPLPACRVGGDVGIYVDQAAILFYLLAQPMATICLEPTVHCTHNQTRRQHCVTGEFLSL